MEFKVDIKYFKFIKEKKVIGNSSDHPVVKIVADSDEFVPSYQTEGAAGADLRSSVDVVIKPMTVEMVDVGFSCKIPAGYHAKITARSSMGKKGILVSNSPGIIDSDFVGRVRVLLLNLSGQDFLVSRGDRIAQWLVEKNISYFWENVDSLEQTNRDSAGFGTTGK